MEETGYSNQTKCNLIFFLVFLQVTSIQLVGYSLALSGFVWYNVAKARQVPVNIKGKGEGK